MSVVVPPTTIYGIRDPGDSISRPAAYLFRVVVSDWCRAHVTTEVAILQFQKLQFLGAHVLHVADEAHHLVGVEQSRVLGGDRFLQRNPAKKMAEVYPAYVLLTLNPVCVLFLI